MPRDGCGRAVNIVGLGRLVYCTECGQPLAGLPPIRCGQCGTMQWSDAKPCASALVVSDSRLLLVQRAREPWKSCWDVPGGFCDPGEHPVKTAIREVREETGLEIRVTGFLGIWLDDYNEPERAPKRTMNAYYHAVPIGSINLYRLSTELSGAQFFSTPAIPQAIAFPGHVPSAIRAWQRAAEARMLETPLFDLEEGV